MNDLVPPLLRYGKYCGIGYTGCPGEKPCDALDACCQDHDACIGTDPSNMLILSSFSSESSSSSSSSSS
jgi:hypothetical protein